MSHCAVTTKTVFMPQRKCAVIIGVNKTGGLPILSAATSGAKEFATWAKTQNYETVLFTDDESEVTIHEIKKAVRFYVDKGVYHTMIVYFAGHGFLRSPAEEMWLLSGAPDDPNEAVNLGLSRHLARRCGIPHLIFISDACRTAAGTVRAAGVSGSAVFPNLQYSAGNCDCDIFYATEMGDPAYEIRSGSDGTNYKALFTACMLDGLNGGVPEVIKEISVGDERFSAVLSYELKEYLAKAVPAAAEKFSITLMQNPDAEVTSRPPKHLARIEKSPTLPSSPEPTPKPDGMGFQIKDVSTPSQPSMATKNRAQEFKRNVDAIIAAGQDQASYIETGFKVVGGEAEPLFIHNKRSINNLRKLQFEVHPYLGSTLLLRTDVGITPLAVLPGFVGTVLVDKGQVVNVNYFPSSFSKQFEDAEQLSVEVQRRRARIAANARLGKFELPGSVYDIMGDASYLRRYKALDPTLGLYAAYAYLQANALQDIRSVYEYMNQEKEPILFDVDLLARLDTPQHDSYHSMRKRAWHRAPFCPILTQGWSYLELVEQEGEHLRALKRQLVPGLWTTFQHNTFNILRRLDYKHEIL